MKMFMNWLANTFAPKMNEICSRPWIAAVSSSMQKVIPFILTGSFISITYLNLIYLLYQN